MTQLSIDNLLNNKSIVKIATPIIGHLISDRVQVSVVVPAYNEAMGLIDLLESFNHQDSQNFEVIVVDNGSNDRTVAVCGGFISKAKYNLSVMSCTRVGPGNARRYGSDAVVNYCQYASGYKRNCKLIAYTDADCITPKDWISTLIKSFSNNSFGIAGGAHAAADWVDELIEQRLGISHYFWLFANKNNQMVKNTQHIKISGPNAVISMSAYVTAGGMRQPMINGRVGMKELSDLYKRVAAAGFKAAWIPVVMVASRRRNLKELIYKKEMYYAFGDAQGRFVSIRENERELLEMALTMVPKERWLQYQQEILTRIENNYR